MFEITVWCTYIFGCPCSAAFEEMRRVPCSPHTGSNSNTKYRTVLKPEVPMVFSAPSYSITNDIFNFHKKKRI